ncbi:MAG: hypothetical protein CMQ15_01380 [Gammaproteobacteria bacterium]|jgi:ketosteroid isomerase-like protein|nr:hypothetical protein [Gammaproteobacteria bacterium]HJN94696.1 nuclear transport factor 2 family protein [Gammaproteobacteria bacterium]|tara:strand:- start:13865 stop:14254 length:390 start_codon:yes stop_codon:yes gene_type:complete
MVEEALIRLAKVLIADHEMKASEGDLDSIVINFAQDIVMLAADAPLVVGIDAFREFYAGLLQTGKLIFTHDYTGAEVMGDSVVLYGVARGTIEPVSGDVESFANNFIITVKQTSNGLKIWRAAFAAVGD